MNKIVRISSDDDDEEDCDEEDYTNSFEAIEHQRKKKMLHI
jgi:hypothetical protein